MPGREPERHRMHTFPYLPWYAEGALWLHGGRAVLRGGTLGFVPPEIGTYLCKQSDRVCPPYASGYAATKLPLGKVYLVRVHLEEDEVYDSRNPAHIARIEAKTKARMTLLRGNPATPTRPARPPHWTVFGKHEADFLAKIGFRAAVLLERSAGELDRVGGNVDFFSLVVFDPAALEIVGTVALKNWDSIERDTGAPGAQLKLWTMV